MRLSRFLSSGKTFEQHHLRTLLFQVPLSAKLKSLSIKRPSRVYDLNYSYRFIQMKGPKLKGFAEMAVAKREVFSIPHVHSTPGDLWKKPSHSSQHHVSKRRESHDTVFERTCETGEERSNGLAKEGDRVRTRGSSTSEIETDFPTLPGTNMSPSSSVKEEAFVRYHMSSTGKRMPGQDSDTSGRDTAKQSPRKRGSHSESMMTGSAPPEGGAVKSKTGRVPVNEQCDVYSVYGDEERTEGGGLGDSREYQ